MPQQILPDRDLQRAAESFLARTRPNSPPMPADAHGLEQQFGAPGYFFTGDEQAILVVTKPCVLVEWSIDSTVPGEVRFALSWSDWQTPRVWRDMIGDGPAPYLPGTTNINSTDLSSWNGPLQLNRRDAILIQPRDAAVVEQLTLVLYMKEQPQLTVQPIAVGDQEQLLRMRGQPT
ncbi:MAG TPA: hypothetical protein VGJ60_07625 [Chloroflexota bacterium]